MPLPVVPLGKRGADRVECRDSFIEHRNLDVATEEFLEVAASDPCSPLAGKDRLACQDRLVQAGEHRLTVGVADAVVRHLELLRGGEVGKGKVQDGDEHRQVGVLVGVGANVKGALRRWGWGAEVGELLGGHPLGNPSNLPLVRCNKPRPLDDRGERAQHWVRPPLATHGVPPSWAIWPVIPKGETIPRSHLTPAPGAGAPDASGA